jgi:hypothetical protein
MPGGDDGEVGANACHLGLQKEMIVLRDEGDPFDIAGCEPNKRFSWLKLQIGLVTDVACEPVDLILAVGCGANARIHNAWVRERLGDRYGSNAEASNYSGQAAHDALSI